MYYLSFCDWLISHSIISSRFIHIVACVTISLLKKKKFIGLWLIYNVVLVSAVQQSEYVLHISTPF